jgi:hypothetical protein
MPATPSPGERSRDVAAAALRELVSAVTSTNRILTDLRHRRAAERAALNGGTATSTGLQPDADCCVCYEPLDRPHAVVTACGHVYHRACIENAMESGRTRRCPICRRLIDSAELVQIMNGLPTRTECTDVDFSPSNDDVIDLTQLAPRSAAGSASSVLHCTTGQQEAVGLALDREIHATLERARRDLEASHRIRALEESVEEMLDTASSVVEDAKKQASEEKSQLLEGLKEKTMALKVRETKLRVEEDALRESRSLLNDQIADARRRAEELAISIKATEAANAEAFESRAASDEARVQCEERRLRFQRLASQFEKKVQQQKSERDRIARLEQENISLESQVDALRKQVRRAKGLPPPEPSARNNEKKNGPSPQLPNLEWASNILLENNKEGNCPLQHDVGTPKANPDSEALYDDDIDEEDDDVVGAADEIYHRKQLHPPQTIHRAEDGKRLACASFAETFGPLSGPPASLKDPKTGFAKRARVPSVTAIGRPSVRKGLGLGAFGPEPATAQRRPGPIAASERNTVGRPAFCNQTARRLGVKRAVAPEGNQPRMAKMKNSKIQSFLK